MTPDEMMDLMAAGFPAGVPWVIDRLDDTGVVLGLEADDRTLRPGGTVSGPTLMMLADSAAYAVILSRIGPQALAVTSNLSINFLRRPQPGRLTADGSVLKLGRSLCISDVSIRDAEGRLVAHAVVTYSLALVAGA